MTGESEQNMADVRFIDCSIVTAEGELGSDMGVAVTDGTIKAVGAVDSLPEAHNEVRLNGDVLVPGIIDDHVHTRTPGHEYKEDWETATRAAAAGGITTIIAMPNTDPVIDRVKRLESMYETANDDAIVDYLTHVVVTSENLERIPALGAADIAGFKVFLGITFGDIEAPTDGELHAAMQSIAETGCRLGFHEENDEIRAYLEEKFRKEGKNDAIYHNRSRPPLAEVEAVSRVCLFSEYTGCPVHMFHLSSGSAAETLRNWRHRGVDATAETCPHYLWFTEDVVKERGTIARVQPPIRTADEREQLWSIGIDDGAVDCIATDHAPHTDAEKGVNNPEKSVWETPGGFVGLETQVPAMLTFVNEGRLTLPEWVELHSTKPAKIWGMYPKKGSLQPGADADFTVVDPDQGWILDRSELHSKSTVTPFDGESFRGAVTKTIVRGKIVYDGASVTGATGYGKLATDE